MIRIEIQTNVPCLEISALYTEEGDVIINVLNWHNDSAITTDIVSEEGIFCGPFQVYEMNSPDINASNDSDQGLISTEKKPDVSAKGAQITYTFPARSFTMLKGRTQR